MRRLLPFLMCVVVTTAAFAQETDCTNGLDDDGDGFIDCYDPDCALNAACDDIFIGNDATCTLTPPPAPAFTMNLDFASENETTNHFARMVIGDLDRDGIPEIVTMNKYTRKLMILNGNGGAIKYQAVMANGAEPEWEVAIANLNNDNCAEIFFLTSSATYNAGTGLGTPAAERSKIYVYDCQLNFLYSTPSMPGSNNDPINFGLADFGGDGRVEIYCKDELFNAHTGARLRATTLTSGDWGSRLNGGPVAVDMDGNGDLELVIGLTIFDVNATATNMTVMASRPEYFIRNDYNATSVADFNQDGFMDVIASGSAGCHFNNTTIFFWDVHNNKVLTYSDQDGSINPAPSNSDYEDGWKNGTGRINIADLDGDGRLNLSYVSGKYLYALKDDMTRLWRKTIKEETSGYTGCTLFDFNGDGKSEIVYRDEQSLYIIDGTDGSTFNSQPCISRTNREYPIVADVDADGSTEICVTCGFDDAAAQANFNTTTYSRYSHVRVFKSQSEPWVPARRVWNQHGYFVVNVNDNLTIPKLQQSHMKQFSTVACRPGDPVGPIRPLNKFLNQSPFIDTNGCPAYLAPDLDYATQISFVPPTCPGLDFQVNFTITNRGEVAITGDIPVSFYDSNPKYAGANKITTLTFPISDLDRNQLFVISETITSNGSDSLFVVLNDAGTSVPISLPNTPYLECNYDNVRGIKISPLPVSITAMEVTPNQLCAVPPTGSARAFVPMGGGVENTADYKFYWFNGTTVGPITAAAFEGPIYSGIADGTYSVFGIHKTANCSSDTAQVVINPAPGILPTVTVALKSNQTNCNPPNGSLEASVSGGNSGYTFEWEDIAAPIGVSGPLLTGRTSGTYTVIVTHTQSGCQTSADGTIGDLTQEPDVVATATPITSCTNLLSGTVSAEAFKGLTAQPDANYVFEWYFYDNATSTRGSLIPPVHGALGTPDRTGLPVGYYEVTLTEIATGCTGNPTGIVQVTDQRVTPVVTITRLAPQTSCDPANPNGRLQASVTINGVLQPASDWTFEWFNQQNTLPANAHTTVSGVNGSIAEKVKGGGQTYRVRATNVNGCFDIEDGTVLETIVHPVVTLTMSPNGICNPALASSSFTGSLTVTATFGGSPVTLPDPNYSFKWFDGTQAVGAPRPETTPALTQLDSGYYTVVVTRTDLGCAALPETKFVTNTTVLPVILTDTDSSTNCTPLLPGVTANGLGRAKKVDGLNPNPATHTFQWHTGINTAAPIVGATNSSLGSLQGGVGQFYTVLVTNRSNGCQKTATVEIPDAQEKPIITLLPSDNSICDPTIAGTTKNGSVLVQTVTYKGAPFAGARTHQWFNGVGTGTPNTSTTAATLPNLAAGFYSATVTLTATGCVSDFVPAEVEDNLVLPVVLTTPNPSTNCSGGTPNGDIGAAVDVLGVPTTAGFSFRWFTGAAITDPAVPNSPNNGNTQHAIQLQGGQNFTVEATNLSSGCKNTKTLMLQDGSEIPVITPLVFSPNVNCTAPFNGTAGVAATPFTYRGTTINNPYTGFTLTWSGGTVNAAGDGISALSPGTYTLQVRAGAGNTVTSNNDNCISTLAQVTILDDFTYPIVDITETNQTSCDNALPNGQLQAVETSGTGSYSFDWYLGPVVGALGTELAEISDGLTTKVLVGGTPGTDYTVRVRNTSTRCETVQTTLLTDNITLPSLLLLSPTAVTNCANPNGAIDATPTVTSLTNNNFTIFYVKQNTTDPDAVKTDPDPTRFQTSTVAQIDRTNLGPGFFASLVRDEITHCESQVITVQVQDQTDPADITINGIVAATACNATGGAIDINVTGVAPPFTFKWHSGGPTNSGPYDYINDEDGTTIPSFSDPGSWPSPVPSTEDLAGVGVGLYTVEVIDQRGCGTIFSESVPFQNPPALTVTHTNSTQCDITAGDGTITTTLTGTTNYTIHLYRGSNIATAVLVDSDGPFAGGGPPIIVTTTSLDPADYIIEIVDNSISCSMFKTQTIGVDARDPVVTLGTITGNTSCTPGTTGDGSVQITIAKDPLDPRPAATPLVYEITAVAPAPLVGSFPTTVSTGLASTSTTINGLGPQQYQITVTETSSGCSIDRFVTVPNQPVMPNLGASNVTIINDSFCAPNSNGRAEVVSITPVAIANYEFSWYANLAAAPVYQANGGGGNGELFNSTKPGYTLGAPGQGTGTQTFFVRGERLAGTGLGVGCTTPAVQVVIQDEHVTPVMTLNSTPDTSCDPAIGEGTISIRTVTTSPAAAVQNALYTYTLNPGAVTLPNQNGALQTPVPFTQLTDATYTVVATNQVSGCPVTGTRVVAPGIFNVMITSAAHSDKLICLPDGDITAQQITIDRTLTSQGPQVFNTPLAANFEFRWFKSAPGTFTTGTPLADGSSAVITTEQLVVGGGAGQYNDPAPALGAGTYYVVARQLTGPGKFGAFCESVPTRVEILDKSESPVVALAPTTDTSCNGPFEGSISVRVTDPMTPGGLGYNYTWTALTAGRTPPGPVTNPYNGNNNLFPLVQDGVYQITALNNLTGCQSIAAQTTVSKTAIPIVVASATNTDQLICNPDGSITVVDITVNGVIDGNHNHFNFLWYKNSVVAGAELVPINPPGNDLLNTADLPTTMGAGIYFVKAQRILGLPLGSGCESAPYRVDVLDKSVDPDLDFTFQPNSSCNPTNPNGTVIATAKERDLTTDNYTFNWAYNGGALPGVTTQTDVSPTSTLANAFEGNYLLRTTNTLTGCGYTEGVAVTIDRTISLPNIVTVQTVDPVDCFPTGSARVTQITIGGTTTFTDPPDDINTTFNYQWYQGTVPGGIMAGQINSLLPNQLPDRYFVTVEDLSTNCISSFVEVTIDSADIVYPVVAIQQTSPQASCNAAFGTGSLAATADGQTGGTYSFTWFPSTNLSGTSFANTSTVTGLFSGGYSVRAFNSLTNCSASALFIVPVDSLTFTPQLELTSGPLTECDSIDGAVFIRGLPFPVTANPSDNYPFAYNYTADLYVGSPPANLASPEHPNVPNDPNNPLFLESFVQPNLVNGIYTVRLTDNNTGCIKIDTISVKDARVFPKPTITEIAPVVNCDPNRPNGVARALVNGSFNGFRFEWFEGATPTGPILYTGSQYDELHPTPIQYTVLATQVVTGCTGTVTTTISNGQVAIPSPDIKVESNVTSCVVNNGALSASVGGNVKDYIFNWFDPPPTFVGPYYDSIAVGTYSVTATSRITGCVSPPTSEDIIAEPVFPEIDFQVQPATCGQNNGSVSLSVVSTVAIQSITWSDASGALIQVGPGLDDVYAGTYNVTVVTILGCESEQEVTIDTEIRPRNFISRNGDNSNSYFHIDCIENFTIANGAAHDNKVKIFNRVGTLVYEMDGYDNVEIFFNGKSNKGIGTNLMGTDLPDGTYFFIVDKKNGEKPMEGYLEIVK